MAGSRMIKGNREKFGMPCIRKQGSTQKMIGEKDTGHTLYSNGGHIYIYLYI